MGEAKRRARNHFDAQAPEHRLGDAPIEDKHYIEMVAIARTLDEMFNGQARGVERNTGFVLMVFPFNDHGGRCNYISNGADRRDIMVLMREMLARFEGAPEQSGTA